MRYLHIFTREKNCEFNANAHCWKCSREFPENKVMEKRNFLLKWATKYEHEKENEKIQCFRQCEKQQTVLCSMNDAKCKVFLFSHILLLPRRTEKEIFDSVYFHLSREMHFTRFLPFSILFFYFSLPSFKMQNFYFRHFWVKNEKKMWSKQTRE